MSTYALMREDYRARIDQINDRRNKRHDRQQQNEQGTRNDDVEQPAEIIRLELWLQNVSRPLWRPLGRTDMINL
jgi:uncharacterized protein (UPF0218 family)